MKYLLALLLIPFLSASGCGNHKERSVSTTKNGEPAKDSVPACIRDLIEAENKQTPANGPVQVDEYVYNNKTVYLVTAHCCDQYNMLYDDSCKAICAPSGGFTGRGDSKCKDFDSTARHVKLIWKNPAK